MWSNTIVYGSVDRVLAMQAWEPEFNPRDQHDGRRRRLTPQSYQLTPTDAPRCAHLHTHTTYTHEMGGETIQLSREGQMRHLGTTARAVTEYLLITFLPYATCCKAPEIWRQNTQSLLLRNWQLSGGTRSTSSCRQEGIWVGWLHRDMGGAGGGR